ncbi:MAG: glycosyltransferase family 2 protein [Thermoanaerobaculia bacterium]|nr:glycosyltransferase family 2 protein [Thermoanaerobaculia bacterium]
MTPDPPLEVSVVMPVRNEGAFIERALSAVLAQDFPCEKTEILVVDGASDDDTVEVAQRCAAAAGRKIRVLDNPGRIAAKALNIAVRAAHGRIIVRVDGHCIVAGDFVRRSVESLEESESIGCVGGVLDTVGEGLVGRGVAAAMSSRFGVGGSAFRVGTREAKDVDTVAFPAFRAEALASAGPFDEELVRNQDDEYSYRLRSLGYRVVLDPAIRATYFSRATLRSTLRQYRQYGWWKVRVLQKHPRQMRARQFVPPLFVAAIGGSLALLPVTVWPLVGLLTAYGLANGAASLAVARDSGWSLLPVVSAAFACLHFGYGIGFLAGLVRFAGRWRDTATPAWPTEDATG